MDDQSDLFSELDKGAPQAQTLYEKDKADQGWLERLLDRVPGLRGYRELNRRRDADQSLRMALAEQLLASRLQLSNVHQALSRDIIKAIEYAEPLGRIDTRLMGLIGKIEDAPTGYSGFFDAHKIREEELAAIYAFDERLFDHADTIAASVGALEKATNLDGDMQAAIRDLDNAVQNANLAFGERQGLLAGLTA